MGSRDEATVSEGPVADGRVPTPLILYDGVCGLCTSSVRYVISRDPRKRFTFASMQSPLGQTLLARFQLPRSEFETFVLVTENGHVVQSTAALKVAKELGGLWPLLYALILVPAPIRDLVYRIVARNRYRWFGRRDTCFVPSSETRDRFLDG
ncbi:MAG: thiol-disulfide oxidoreductase DCC family protein [Nitrospirae bacterium]|nr:thiol-disulfide oxidoreductase DCC family protein [Nitrospirota bacterium]